MKVPALKKGYTMPVQRFEKNPIITTGDVPFQVNSIFNAGAVKMKDRYILLCRAEMPSGRSAFVRAVSTDGIHFKVDSNPCLTPDQHGEWLTYVQWGIEDARITALEGNFYLLYTGYSPHLPLVMLAQTKDFEKYNILGPITEPSNKDAVLFPEKIDGFYWKLDRPTAENKREIWISRSPDLLHWGWYKFLMQGESGTWENDKIGASSPPLRTKEGWLLLYHGVRGFGISSIYRLGVVLLDLERPWKVKGKCKAPILSPEKDYERQGDVPNVIFSNGWIVEDSQEVKIYYSGADTNVCLATTNVDYLLSLCR
jgi:predicted GH43/DUF377 family glycosyl hydrolase